MVKKDHSNKCKKEMGHELMMLSQLLTDNKYLV